MTSCEKSLFILTVGPVSSFIEGSRKMRDLYGGSFLLSYLMNEVLKEIHSDSFQYKNNLCVIIPCFKENQKSYNIPNRLVGITDLDEKDQKELGTQLEKYILETYKKICKRVYSCVKISKEKYEIISNQLRSMLHIYWTFVPLKNGYNKDYPLLVNKINQIKSIRPFTQLKEPAHKKCSLYPQLNAIIVNSPNLKENEKHINLVHSTKDNKFMYAVKEKEHLSSFAFLKRAMTYANIDGYDSSITSVAYMLANNSVGRSFPDLLKNFRKLEESGGIESVYDLQNKQRLTTEEYSQQNIETAHKVYQELIDNKIELKCYYAIIKIDGDGFGDLYRKHAEITAHKVFSRNIIKFSTYAKDIINKYDGVTIYAGGEDFLVFLPIDNIFLALKELRLNFQQAIKYPGYEKSLTFSAGITIAHYMEPLSEVIRYTSEMEHYAKQIDSEKDAFAIKLMKRSGEYLTIRLKFGDKGKNLDLLNDIGRTMVDANTSKRMIHNLATVLGSLENNDSQVTEEMVHTLVKSFVDKADITPKQELINALCELYSTMKGDIRQFCNILNFLSFLIRECK